MMLGGDDVVLLAPARRDVADVILRACRQHWRDSACVFEDVAGDRAYPLSDRWVWEVGTTSREFFVYRSQADADRWAADGAIPTIPNSMFYFIIGDPVPSDPRFIEVAFVFDKRTADVRRFIHSLQAALRSMFIPSPEPEAAA